MRFDQALAVHAIAFTRFGDHLHEALRIGDGHGGGIKAGFGGHHSLDQIHVNSVAACVLNNGALVGVQIAVIQQARLCARRSLVNAIARHQAGW